MLNKSVSSIKSWSHPDVRLKTFQKVDSTLKRPYKDRPSNRLMLQRKLVLDCWYRFWHRTKLHCQRHAYRALQYTLNILEYSVRTLEWDLIQTKHWREPRLNHSDKEMMTLMHRLQDRQGFYFLRCSQIVFSLPDPDMRSTGHCPHNSW